MSKYALNTPISSFVGRRVWLIGASSGIGAALAQQLLAQGASVIVSARPSDRLNALVVQSSHSIGLAFDVTQVAEWQRAWRYLNECQLLPDLVVFCAADYQPEHGWQIESSRVLHSISVNLLGVYYGLELILPHYIQQAKGGIAIIASVAGYTGLPGAPVYGPSKAALINLAELLYSELKPKNLDIYLINPGFVKTPLTDKNTFTMPALISPQQAAQYIVNGLKNGNFEIHFPYRLTVWLKLLRILPYKLVLPLLGRVLHR